MPKTNAIFLSHSGAQKDFTEQLCLDLFARHRYSFFDMYSVHSSDNIPEVIFQAAKQCRIAVLVLSEEFFSRSKWPMVEVQTFLDSQISGLNPHIKIISLFFRISCKDFEARALDWVQKWKEWAISDDRIDVVKWQETVQNLKRIKGIEFQPGMGEVAYRRSIVQTMLISMIMEPVMENFPCRKTGIGKGARLFGMYGVFGSGKTTICKILHNYYLETFNDRSCHIQLGVGFGIVELQKKVLKELTGASKEWLEELTDSDVGQKYVKERYKVFLALDNVSDTQSLQIARMFLACEFKTGSMVFVTSRSLQVLPELFGYDIDENSSIYPLPDLSEEEAIDILLQTAKPGCTFASLSVNEQKLIRECTLKCRFKRDEMKRIHNLYAGFISEGQYHPRALSAIGSQLRSNTNSWVDNKKSLNFEDLFSEMKETFESFLSEKHKKIFLDIALHAPSDLCTVEDVCHWLALVHEMEYDDMILVLKDLESKSLLYEWENGSKWMRMHELCREFAESISNKKPYSMEWCFYQSNAGLLPPELTRKHSCGLELDLRGMKRLRSVDLKGCNSLENIKGLSQLEDLAWFRLSQENIELHGVEETDGIVAELINILLRLYKSSIRPLLFKSKLDRGLAELKYCRKLKVVEISSTRICHPPDLSKCKQLEVVIVSQNEGFQNGGVNK
eukprot:Gb_35098 [translate_table: standard]